MTKKDDVLAFVKSELNAFDIARNETINCSAMTIRSMIGDVNRTNSSTLMNCYYFMCGVCNMLHDSGHSISLYDAARNLRDACHEAAACYDNLPF